MKAKALVELGSVGFARLVRRRSVAPSTESVMGRRDPPYKFPRNGPESGPNPLITNKIDRFGSLASSCCYLPETKYLRLLGFAWLRSSHRPLLLASGAALGAGPARNVSWNSSSRRSRLDCRGYF